MRKVEDGWYELEELGMILACVGPGDQVLEVGGGIGYTACHLARLVGPGGRVVVVEPAAANVATIERHLTRNGFRNAAVVRACLGCEQETVQRYAGWSHSDEALPPPERSVEALCRDTALAPTHLVLDCEGAEYELFRREASWFERARPMVLAEVHPEILGRTWEEIVAPLVSFGYLCLRTRTLPRGTALLIGSPRANGSGGPVDRPDGRALPEIQ